MKYFMKKWDMCVNGMYASVTTARTTWRRNRGLSTSFRLKVIRPAMNPRAISKVGSTVAQVSMATPMVAMKRARLK